MTWICDRCEYEYSACLGDDEVPAICECGGKIRQTVTPDLEQRMLKGLRQLIDYNWGSEQQHYFEEGEPDNHVFRVLQDLNFYVETRENELT